jgi:choline-sulfatase
MQNEAAGMIKPNILFIMTDQQRFDTIAALGNSQIYTPNLDRLVQRGVAFTNAYSTCPVCVPARYNIRTGREPFTTGIFQNEPPSLVSGQPRDMEERCGIYLARRMGELGYRTFGIGKFHTIPRDEEIGYEVYLPAGEMGGPDDEFVRFIAEQHPEYRHVEQLHGERTNMYYVPQLSPLPVELTMEAWAADRAIEQISVEDERPFFGFVSFIGPHPPCAPPIPFNRMYDPDRMPDPILGDPELDWMDERIPWNNYFIYAEEISVAQARNLRSRYYGEISFIDACIGRILDALEQRLDAENP